MDVTMQTGRKRKQTRSCYKLKIHILNILILNWQNITRGFIVPIYLFQFAQLLESWTGKPSTVDAPTEIDNSTSNQPEGSTDDQVSSTFLNDRTSHQKSRILSQESRGCFKKIPTESSCL